MPPRRGSRGKQDGGSLLPKIILAAVAIIGVLAVRHWYTKSSQGSIEAKLQEESRRIADEAAAEEAARLAAMSPAEKTVDLFINEHRVAVFSKSYCPWSKKGKAIMQKHVGEEMAVMELDQLPADDEATMNDIQDELQKITGARTVPRIFVDGQFIGGASDVEALDANGKLEAMLKDKGLISG